MTNTIKKIIVNEMTWNQVGHLFEFFFMFRNKSSVENLSRLIIHPHQGSIYSACFSHDGTQIASSGASKTLKVSKQTGFFECVSVCVIMIMKAKLFPWRPKIHIYCKVFCIKKIYYFSIFVCLHLKCIAKSVHIIFCKHI